MGYLINDVILLFIIISIITCWIKEKYQIMVALAVFSYICAPVIKFREIGMNPSYLITAVLFVLFLISIIKSKEIKLTRYLIIYIVCSALSITVILTAWGLYGQCHVKDIIHFMGMLQIVFGVFVLYFFFSRIEKKGCFFLAVKFSIVWNFFLTIVQIFFSNMGMSLTKTLYTYPGKDAPVSVMEEAGRFLRGFGSFYSPTETGGFCLFAATIIIICIFQEKNLKSNLLYLFFVMFTGLFAFSKTVILGIFVVLVVLIVICFLQKEQISYKRFALCFITVLLSFFIVGTVGKSIGLSGQVDYYFGKILNPLSSFETRYGDFNETKNSVDNNAEIVDETKTTKGNLESSMEIIRKNYIIGVGPVSVKGEFVGDSQYIVSLHDGGLINMFILLFLYLSLFLGAWKHRKTGVCLWIVVLAMECLVIPVFSCAYFIPFLVFCIVSISDKAIGKIQGGMSI